MRNILARLIEKNFDEVINLLRNKGLLELAGNKALDLADMLKSREVLFHGLLKYEGGLQLFSSIQCLGEDLVFRREKLIEASIRDYQKYLETFKRSVEVSNNY